MHLIGVTHEEARASGLLRFMTAERTAAANATGRHQSLSNRSTAPLNRFPCG